MIIDFHDETNTVTEDYIDLIDRLIRFAAKEEGVPVEAEISITFVDNREIPGHQSKLQTKGSADRCHLICHAGTGRRRSCNHWR